MAKRIICAACRYGPLILCGARHWDRIMSNQYLLAKATGAYPSTSEFEQGFIDQYGNFYNREEALTIARLNDQKIDYDRNGSTTELYSEGLY